VAGGLADGSDEGAGKGFTRVVIYNTRKARGCGGLGQEESGEQENTNSVGAGGYELFSVYCSLARGRPIGAGSGASKIE